MLCSSGVRNYTAVIEQLLYQVQIDSEKSFEWSFKMDILLVEFNS